jgi:dTMP kinase
MAHGTFISFEGPEGSGKTTQASRLAARLQAAGHELLRVREPGGTPTGEAIREILQHDKAGEPICPATEVLLFAASRAQLVAHRIAPALEAGTWVISDRFADSTTAYQGFGRGFGVEDMLAINAFAIQGTRPEVTFLLDLPVEEGLRRIQRRSEARNKALDRIEQEALEFHQRVRDGYLDLARREPDRFHIVNALQSEDAIEGEIWDQLQHVLAT